MTVAIVVGGAQGVLAEAAEAATLCPDSKVYFTNDMIAEFPYRGVAVTLHKAKLDTWLHLRRACAYPEPDAIWCQSQNNARGVTHRLDEWGGSVGLFAVKIALHEGHNRIILAGVPMSPEKKHFLRNTPWTVGRVFWPTWVLHDRELKDVVRSMSGRTRHHFGAPTLEWLHATTTNSRNARDG
jgi:hypothetical protein